MKIQSRPSDLALRVIALIISNEEMEDILKQIKIRQKNKKADFFQSY